MDHPSFMGVLLEAGYTILTGAISWAAMEAGLWLRARASQAKGWAVLAKVTELASNYVAHAETHLRPEFEKLTTTGTLSTEGAQELKAAVLAALKAAVAETFSPSDLRAALGVTGGGTLDTILSGLIERALGALKASQPAPIATAPTVAAVGRVVVSPKST